MRTLLFLLAASTLSAQLGPCTIERVAGGGTLARGDGGPAVEAELFDPRDVRVGRIFPPAEGSFDGLTAWLAWL